MTVAGALLALAVGVAIGAAGAAMSYLPSLDQRATPLTREPAWIGAASPPLARRVVLVIVDGLRLDASYGRPVLDGLRGRGVDAAARSHYPTVSHPNYVTLLTGVPPRWSGVRTNLSLAPVRLDSLLRRAREAGRRSAFVADLGRGIPQLFPADLDAGAVVAWPGGLVRAVRSALDDPADLVVVLVGTVDAAGHEHGGDSAAYREAARRVDAELGEALAGLDLVRDAVVVVADHGHLDDGGHGGVEPEVTVVPLVLAGAGVRRGATLVDARLSDVAPTVAALLGVPAPGHALGRVLTDALDVPPAARAALRRADAARHDRLRPVLTRALIDEARLRWRVSTRRATLVAAGLLLLGGASLLAVRRGLIRTDRRVLLTALPAFPVSFYTMLLAFEDVLSPSRFPTGDRLAPELLVYGAIAAAAHLGAAWIALAGRAVPRERLAAVAGLTLVGLGVALAPAGLAWALDVHALPGGPLPPPRLLLVPPVTYCAVGCYAASAALTLGVEYVVFLARSSAPARARTAARA